MFWSESFGAVPAPVLQEVVFLCLRGGVSAQHRWCKVPVTETPGLVQWVGLLPPGVEEERVGRAESRHLPSPAPQPKTTPGRGYSAGYTWPVSRRWRENEF